MTLSFPFDILYFKCTFRGNVTCTYQLRTKGCSKLYLKINVLVRENAVENNSWIINNSLGKFFVSSKWHGRCQWCANFLMSEGAERLEMCVCVCGGLIFHLAMCIHTPPPPNLFAIFTVSSVSVINLWQCISWQLFRRPCFMVFLR